MIAVTRKEAGFLPLLVVVVTGLRKFSHRCRPGVFLRVKLLPPQQAAALLETLQAHVLNDLRMWEPGGRRESQDALWAEETR